jgi:hypothetical protein
MRRFGVFVDDGRSPQACHQILEFLADVVIEFCLMQLEAGAPDRGRKRGCSLISDKMCRVRPALQQRLRSVRRAGGLIILHL